MNEAQAAQELRGSFVESVLLMMSRHGGSMAHEELDDFTGDPMATRDALVELHERRMLEQPDSEGGRLTPFGARTAARIRQSLLSAPARPRNQPRNDPVCEFGKPGYETETRELMRL